MQRVSGTLKAAVTASVTELGCFCVPQDGLVKPRAKFSNKRQLAPPHSRENKKKRLERWDERASGMGEQTGVLSWKQTNKKYTADAAVQGFF